MAGLGKDLKTFNVFTMDGLPENLQSIAVYRSL